MTPLSDDDARARQLALLDRVAAHCAAEGLTWYLCAGTLLGAVRHEGYVPWDDDVDVMLPRADYERFCASFAGSLRTSAVPGYVLPFAKVCDDETVLDVESDVVRDLGIYVDVFPLDGWLPGVRGAAQSFALARLLDLMRVKHLTLGRSRRGGRTLLLGLLKVALAWLPASAIGRLLTRVGSLADAADSMGVIVWGYQERVPAAAYGEAVPLTFEGRTLPGPADPDTVLRVLYGDWRTLPPVSERTTHHRFTAYLR